MREHELTLREISLALDRVSKGELGKLNDHIRRALYMYGFIDDSGAMTPRGELFLKLYQKLTSGEAKLEDLHRLRSLLDQEVYDNDQRLEPWWVEAESLRMETFLVHGLTSKLDPYRPLQFPIYPSVNYEFRGPEHAAEVFSKGPLWPSHLMPEDYIYARGATPTTRALELSLARIEGGVDAVVFDSGMSAITAAVMGLSSPGDLVLSISPIYGETFLVFDMIGKRIGLEVEWYTGWDSDELSELIKEKRPKLVYLEVPSNPILKVFDIRKISQVAREVNAITIVDNTFASPYLQRPLELGADIVVESMTKFISGHSDLIGGLVSSRSRELISKVRKMLFVTGGVLDSFRAWLFMRSLKTLHVRVEKQCNNAEAIAKFLEDHPAVSKVYYPGLKSHPNYKVALNQMRRFGSLISLELKGGYEAGMNFIRNLKVFRKAVSLGAVESLAEHPASMTHSMMPREEREKAGITDGLIRLSIGIENLGDLIDDLKQALDNL